MINLNYEIKRYLDICSNIRGLSPHTIKAYRTDIRQFYEYIHLHDYLSKDDIIEYIDWLYKKYKPKSAKRKIACIKAFYRYMETENIINENPFHKIRIKHKMPVLLPKIIPLNHIELLLNYAYKQLHAACSYYQKETTLRNATVLELLFLTGMRVSEISQLKSVNLDLKSNNIRVIGKGTKERIICITNSQIISMLKEYTSTYNSNFEYVFRNRLNHPLSEQSIRNMINNYAKAAEIPMHITPHMFRHTFATSLLDEDVDIRYIQQLLGHSSIVTTQIYTHISTTKIRHILEDKHPRNKLIFTASRY